MSTTTIIIITTANATRMPLLTIVVFNTFAPHFSTIVLELKAHITACSDVVGTVNTVKYGHTVMGDRGLCVA